ncbi:MAG: HD domain-containing protein [Lachnospiraceae bacterium]|nr:HD domain-containing protein [Lachnospiraceae bacterium]
MASEKKQFDQFVERMKKIRELSSPPLYDFDNADDYIVRLKNNFETIGKLAAENREMLDNILFPILNSDQKLTDEMIEDMSELSDKLLSLAEEVTTFENLDLPIMTLVSDRLLENALSYGSPDEKVLRLDGALLAYYSLMNMTERIYTDLSISQAYKQRGLEISGYFLEMMEKDRILEIKDPELRGLVLTNARFSTSFYERSTDPKENELNLELLERMLQISEDPFYHEAVPDFDWRYFLIRTYGYFLQCTDMGNMRGFTKGQLRRIVEIADKTEELIATDPEYFNGINGGMAIPFQIARNRYYLGVISEKEYRNVLLEAYEKRDRNDFGSPDGNFCNVLVPVEFLYLMRDKKLSAEDVLLLKHLYQGLNAYMFRMPNPGALSFVLEYFGEAVRLFIEVPGGLTFEAFALQTLAALHPPTYIHSQMVGQISVCLCSYLIEARPDLLIGFPGTRDVADVKKNRERILSYVWHAAVCHDVGKILVIDTIFVYGRKLLDDEFKIITTHPEMGYELLKKHASTRGYAEVALGHHRFFDDSRGYPVAFETAHSPFKVIIDIVQCADCMDAATDSVGRSYNKGKTIENYITEVNQGRGSRYASWLMELFGMEEVKRDLNFLLTVGRQEIYRDTYLLLKNVKEKEK